LERGIFRADNQTSGQDQARESMLTCRVWKHIKASSPLSLLELEGLNGQSAEWPSDSVSLTGAAETEGSAPTQVVTEMVGCITVFPLIS
jgi:hypothetical protein